MAQVSNARTHKISDAKIYLRHHFRSQQPVMLWGPPGIGKSALVQQITDDWNIMGKKSLLIDVRLPLWEPTDIKGIPYYNQEENTMKWAHPTELPSQAVASEYEHVVLFLDELNGAAPAVQAAAYQLVLNRRVGEYRLPDNVVLVAAGNRETDKGVTYRMPKPLANRFLHYEVAHNIDDWIEWATSPAVSILPDVVGYLSFSPKDLNKFDARSPEKSFPTPRSWEFVSNLLKESEGFSNIQLLDMVAAAIGEGTALQFDSHRKHASKLPDPRDILNGKVKELKTKEISAMHSLATSIAYEIREANQNLGKGVTQKQMNSYMDNAVGFWMDNFENEMVVLCFRMIIPHKYGISFDIAEIKNWKRFYERYGDLVREA